MQQINSKLIRVRYNIWILAEGQGYIVQFKPNQCVNKEKQFASSTKWKLGENAVLWQMECYLQLLFIIYLWITIPHLFVCFPALELATFQQQVFPTKKDYANALSLGTRSCKKRNVATLTSTHQAKHSATLTVVSWNYRRMVYIVSSESFEPKRFVQCCNKIERKCIQEQQPN